MKRSNETYAHDELTIYAQNGVIELNNITLYGPQRARVTLLQTV